MYVSVHGRGCHDTNNWSIFPQVLVLPARSRSVVFRWSPLRVGSVSVCLGHCACALLCPRVVWCERGAWYDPGVLRCVVSRLRAVLCVLPGLSASLWCPALTSRDLKSSSCTTNQNFCTPILLCFGQNTTDPAPTPHRTGVMQTVVCHCEALTASCVVLLEQQGSACGGGSTQRERWQNVQDEAFSH